MTKVIIISSESDVDREADLVKELLTAGCERFHLRKPHWTAARQKKFLDGFEPEHRSRMSVHQHHGVAMDTGIGGLHFKAHERMKAGEFTSKRLFSTSCHSVAACNELEDKFDYCLAGPVFDSISKKGYMADFRETEKLRRKNVFALGGITERNAGSALAMGFYGVAALGYIWTDPSLALTNYLKLENACKAAVHTY